MYFMRTYSCACHEYSPLCYKKKKTTKKTDYCAYDVYDQKIWIFDLTNTVSFKVMPCFSSFASDLLSAETGYTVWLTQNTFIKPHITSVVQSLLLFFISSITTFQDCPLGRWLLVMCFAQYVHHKRVRTQAPLTDCSYTASWLLVQHSLQMFLRSDVIN